MKKLLMTLAAIPAATMAVEASAQTYGNNNASATLQNQVAQLQAQLNNGIQTGAIDSTEAQNLRQQIRQLNRLERQYSANGLTQQEWNILQQRVGTVNQQLQSFSGGYAYGNQPYGNAYGYNGNRAPAYDQYGRPVPTVTYDQYGRQVQGGYYGQGGPYEQPYAAPRSNGIGNVLGGVLGSMAGGGGGLGSILGGGGLNVGTVITSVLGSALGGVPRNHADQYQSNGSTYFRSDGQRVYEIDSRTNTVVRVHPLR